MQAGQLEITQIKAVPLEADDHEDSVFGDNESETASLASSIFNYRKENDRTYHAYKAGGEKDAVLPCC